MKQKFWSEEQLCLVGEERVSYSMTRLWPGQPRFNSQHGQLFSLYSCIHTSSGAHPTYHMSTEASFHRDKATRIWKQITYLYLVSRLSTRRAIPSPHPHYVFIAWCLIKHRGNSYLLQLNMQRYDALKNCVMKTRNMEVKYTHSRTSTLHRCGRFTFISCLETYRLDAPSRPF
jgi:hypothetical protein